MMTIRHYCRVVLTTALVTAALGANANGPMSASYEIKWDVVDGGGDTALSASYTMQDSVAQPSALGISSSASYTLQPGFFAPPDEDADGVRSFMDNCTQDANADQRDTNADGFGNRCDPDLNNDNNTNAIDLGILRLNFFTADMDADLNGDGFVNVQDLGILRQRFFTSPGPSGIAP